MEVNGRHIDFDEAHNGRTLNPMGGNGNKLSEMEVKGKICIPVKINGNTMSSVEDSKYIDFDGG